jgi:hypothetical protein
MPRRALTWEAKLSDNNAVSITHFLAGAGVSALKVALMTVVATRSGDVLCNILSGHRDEFRSAR